MSGGAPFSLTSGPGVNVEKDDVEVVEAAETLNFEGPVNITDEGSNKVSAEVDAFATGEYIDVSTKVPDAGKPIKLDAGGEIDGSMVDEADDDFTVIDTVDGSQDVRFRARAAPFGGFTIDKPNSTSGFLNFMPNAETTQITFSDPAAATGVNRTFLDVDNGGDMYLQTLPGAGASGELILSDGAPTRPDNDATSDLGRSDKRWKDFYSQTTNTDEVDYENLGTHTTSKVGGFIFNTIPDCSTKPSFFTSGANEGELEFYEIYEGATQTTINRRARVDLTYDVDLNPTVETWKIYDPADGTTVVRTITITHTWSGVDLTKSVEVTT